MFQFTISKYGTVGDGGTVLGANPFQLKMHVLTQTAKEIWIKDYASLAAAKTGANGVFASATPTIGTTSNWTDSADGSESYTVSFVVV